MESNIFSISSNTCNVRQDVFPLDQWTITTRRGIIMQSKCTCKSSEQSKTPTPPLPPSPKAQQQQQKHMSDKDLDKEPVELCDLCRYQKFLPQLHTMPDMLFNNNLLRLEHLCGVGIEFNPLDALKLVEETNDPLRVAVAHGWQSARSDFPFAKSITRPFDWTFTTDYRGTFLSAIKKSNTTNNATLTCNNLDKQRSPGKDDPESHEVDENSERQTISTSCTESALKMNNQSITTAHRMNKNDRLCLNVTETDERIDVNKLKVKEEILFYDDITLFEDELADHGTALYSVKVRVMPSSLFILARYYLRIDGVMARINDTRLYHELNEPYILREYTNREAKLAGTVLPVSTVTNPSELMSHLPLIYSRYEKLTLPEIAS